MIGDRETDAQLAANLGCKSLILGRDGMTWSKIAEILFAGERTASIERITKETSIRVEMNIDGHGRCNINTGLGFFDHMLEQIAKHGQVDLDIECKGDLNVDEHHTIEDTAIVLGQCIEKCLDPNEALSVMVSVCLWTIVLARRHSTLAVVHGSIECRIQARAHRRDANRDVPFTFSRV